MKLYLKWFYGYKNFWDEMLFFWLLNYLQANYNPESFTVEVWDRQQMQSRTQQNKSFLNTGILDKLDFVENAENSQIIRRINQILALLWFDKYKKYFKVFGWWEVLDESRWFPHNGRNLLLLHHYAIRKWQFILVWGIGSDNKKSTKRLYKYLLPKAQKIICREVWSEKIAKKYSTGNIVLYEDFSKKILSSMIEGSKSLSSLQENIILINIWPKYFTKDNLNKIKKYISTAVGGDLKSSRKHKTIFFPADINYDKQFYTQLRKEIPELEIYDRTKHSLSETIDLFKSCLWWVWSRLHFLYPLKLFKKDFISISSSDKVKKMI